MRDVEQFVSDHKHITESLHPREDDTVNGFDSLSYLPKELIEFESSNMADFVNTLGIHKYKRLILAKRSKNSVT